MASGDAKKEKEAEKSEVKKEEKAEKEKRKEARAKKRAADFAKSLEAPRPGVRRVSPEEVEPRDSLEAGSDRLELSGILWLPPEDLADNPFNEYPSLSDEELSELAADIKAKGVLVPLIVRVSEDVLICGHNRRRASMEAKEPKVPVQRVLRLLSEEEEREIMKSENDRRRGGNWSREKKEEFIREHFADRLDEDNRGAHKKRASEKARESSGKETGAAGKKFSELLPGNEATGADAGLEQQGGASKKFNEPFTGEPSNLAAEIEKKSRGKITEGTAKRLVSEMRKSNKKTTAKSSQAGEKSGPSTLSEKDRKRGEKLALHLKTLRATREKLEGKLKSVKEEEKKTLKELKTLGEPELFGVEM